MCGKNTQEAVKFLEEAAVKDYATRVIQYPHKANPDAGFCSSRIEKKCLQQTARKHKVRIKDIKWSIFKNAGFLNAAGFRKEKSQLRRLGNALAPIDNDWFLNWLTPAREDIPEDKLIDPKVAGLIYALDNKVGTAAERTKKLAQLLAIVSNKELVLADYASAEWDTDKIDRLYHPLQNASKELKAELYEDDQDIDIRACHLNILAQEMQKQIASASAEVDSASASENQLENPAPGQVGCYPTLPGDQSATLTYSANLRQTEATFSAEFGLTLDQMKTVRQIFTLNTPKMNPFDALVKVYDDNIEKARIHRDHPWWVRLCRERKKFMQQKGFRNCSELAAFLRRAERRCLNAIIKYFELYHNGMHDIKLLMHDGLIVKSHVRVNLKALETFIFKETGYKLSLKNERI